MQPEAIAHEPVRLRPLAAADIDPIFQACQDPLVQQWTAAVPVPFARSDAEDFVLDYCPTSWAEDHEYTWGIEDPATREFLGVIGLRIAGERFGEVGYWLGPRGRGRGAATRALSAVCRFAFDELQHEAVRWQAILGNEASRRVAERVGFEISPPVRRLLNQRGTRVDGWMGTLLPDDTAPPPPPVLTDGIVTLRAPRGSDLAALPGLVDDEVVAWTGVPGKDPAQLAGWLDAVRRPTRPPAGRFAITRTGGDAVGFLRLSLEPLSHSVTVGWWVGPEARGQGLAYRGVRVALEWAAGHGAHRFAAGIFEGNRASIALAERLGMRAEGLRRAYWPPRRAGDPYRDTWLYSLVAGDPGWPGSA